MFRMYRKTLVVCMEYNANIQNCDKKRWRAYTWRRVSTVRG